MLLKLLISRLANQQILTFIQGVPLIFFNSFSLFIFPSATKKESNGDHKVYLKLSPTLLEWFVDSEFKQKKGSVKTSSFVSTKKESSGNTVQLECGMKNHVFSFDSDDLAEQWISHFKKFC